MLRLRTIGRRTGVERTAILAYLDDGRNLVTLATNGMASSAPAWWLNLEAHPEAVVDLPGGSRAVQARATSGAERERLWTLWAAQGGDLDGHAAARPMEIPVVVLEPRSESPPQDTPDAVHEN
jgi:deazaflavin-dependent oxidoreductase (nitroreductase family)